MTKRKMWLGAVLTLALIIPITSSAETVVRTGDSVSIGISQIVENNLYAAAGSVSHSGEIKGDMYVVAGSITVNGPVEADLTSVGGTTQIHAKVGGDVRIVGGDAVVAGEVGGDVFVIGGHLRLLSSAKVAGNVYFYGGEAEIDGAVTGSVMGRADTFSINGEIGGTDIGATKIILGDQANIRGDLRYQSTRDLQRSMQATVEGEVLKMEGDSQTPQRGGNGSLILLLAWFFTSLVVYLFFRSSLESLLQNIKKDPARVGLIGLAGFVLGPIAAIFLIVTVIGAWAGIILLLATLLLFLISLILLPILLGGYLLGLYRKNDRIDVWSVLTGMFALVLLTLVPFIGGLLIFMGVLLVIGVLLHRVYVAFRVLS